MITFTRVMMVLLFAGIAFLLIVPTAMQHHQTGIAAAIIVLFAVYVVVNIVVWRRMKRRS
jgi:membrane protein implicated in regulation of membrane protease activity